MEKISSDKEAKENAGKSFAIQLANDLEINEQEGLLAFRLFWPCKECILAYLFSIFLNKKDKYEKLLQAIKDAKEKEELLQSAWEDLRRDMKASSNYFAKAQWDMIQIKLFAEKAKPGMTTEEALQRLNSNNPSLAKKP
jgi:hypothetical protein